MRLKRFSFFAIGGQIGAPAAGPVADTGPGRDDGERQAGQLPPGHDETKGPAKRLFVDDVDEQPA